ncbi:chemotaxis-specific protein-glutamate methyltransferase CheB [Novosphingobium sp. BL-8H]|uniref:chemotaxis-specific protein-glutamate methyltransferase CheB n=1 Tax=Novosphingobium sp. BL-8H TaxID=3127640 RepID=UPI00375797FE
MTKLLIVDDSALMRRLLADVFGAAGDFEIACARGGTEALAMLADFAPDVITLDIHMHDMDGLTCLDRIMVLRPCPVVMVSSLTSEGAEETLEAMSLGAVDFVAKPRGAVSLEIDRIAPELVDKVRAAAKAHVPRTARLRERVRALASGSHVRTHRDRVAPAALAPSKGADGIVLVGCSTGGPPALDAVLGALPADLPWPVVVAQHMPASFTGPLAGRLDRVSPLGVNEVTRTTRLQPGNVYIGKGDADLLISRRGGELVALPAPSSPTHHWHPSVDRLVESAMRVVAPECLIGVLMTGMGTDGAAAMNRLREAGGVTIAEAESTAVIWGMPGALVALGGASIILPLDDIAPELARRFAS